MYTDQAQANQTMRKNRSSPVSFDAATRQVPVLTLMTRQVIVCQGTLDLLDKELTVCCLATD